MKICVTAQGGNLDSELDPRFGRCKYFLFVDKETLECEAVENPNIDATGGAGIQSGQFVAGKEAKVVLTGNVGPNAFQTLAAAGIDVVTGLSGSVNVRIPNTLLPNFSRISPIRGIGLFDRRIFRDNRNPCSRNPVISAKARNISSSQMIPTRRPSSSTGIASTVFLNMIDMWLN